MHTINFEPVTQICCQDQEVVELPLLLPRWQVVELEAAARESGMTTGQMIRRVIREVLAERPVLVRS